MEIDVIPRRKREKTYDDLVKVIEWYKKNGLSQIVYPGKSLSNSEIKARVRNKSLKLNVDGMSFSEEKEIAGILGMSRIDLMRSHINEIPKVDDLKGKLAKSKGDGKG